MCMAWVVSVLSGLTHALVRGYVSDTAYYAALRATALLIAMLWVLALALLCGPSSSLNTAPSAPACEPVDPLWLPMCQE